MTTESVVPPRRALVVRGGWDGHVPVEATDLFIPDLTDAGFSVTVSEDLDVYCDERLLAATDLIVQCWSIGTLTDQQSAGLISAVHAGAGFAGCGWSADCSCSTPSSSWSTK